MHFKKSRTKNNGLLLVLTILMLGVGTLISGATNSQTEISNQIHKIRLQSIRGKSNHEKTVSEKSMFFSKETESLFQKQDQSSVLEILAAGDLDTTFGTNGKVTTSIGNSKSEALAVVLQPDGRFVAAGYSFNGSNNDFALVRYNSNGSLDTTFGTGGKVTTDINGADNVSLATAIQSDGKLVAAGSSFNGVNDDFALVRYNSNGTLDSTFGIGGVVATDFDGTFEDIDAVAIQPDGKIVAAGYRLVGSFFDFALARYNSNGTLDTTFGTGGKLTTSFTNLDDLARAISLQTDGKIVVVGEANADFAAARYNTDGSLDTSFDGDGKVTTSINLFDSAYDVALQSDGKIVAAGETGDGNNSDFAVIRYNSNGSLDTTFDSDGIVTTPIIGGDEFASSVVIQSNGKIVAGGFSYNGNNDDFALVRYNSNGSLDTTFASGGKITTDFGFTYDYISALTIQSSNRIIAVGSSNMNFAAAAYSLESGGCTYSLTPTSASFAGTGGSGSFTITTQANCPYAVVSSAPWIIFTDNTSGSGSATINYLVGSNSGVERSATISVNGQTLTVNQALGSKSRKRTRFF